MMHGQRNNKLNELPKCVNSSSNARDYRT